jgi:ribosomal-protein-serine acetyltransferase
MLIATLSRDVELRLLEIRHAPAFHTLVLENLERLYWRTSKPTFQDSEQRIRKGLERLLDATGINTGIFDHGSLCGIVGLARVDAESKGGELGYWIDKGAEGRGFITGGCKAVLRYGFGQLRLHRIELRCAATNHRSSAVAKRLGFQLEGRLRQAEKVSESWDDVLVHGLLASEWEANLDDKDPGWQ